MIRFDTFQWKSQTGSNLPVAAAL